MPVHLTLHQELTTKMRKTFAQSTMLLSSLWRRCVVLCVSLSVLLSFSSLARDNMAKELEHIGVEEHLDGPLPLDALFKNHEGNMVRLGDFFGTKPVLLVLGYHTCPTVCTMIQNAAATSIKDIAWTVGKEFSVVVLSIDPTDTPETAQKRRLGIMAEYGRSKEGFHYLTGNKTEIDRVAKATGFQYEFDEPRHVYAHPSLIMVAKPNGQMARYLYGLQFDANDVRMSLMEAANGKSLSTIEQVILYCFHFDPNAGKYVLMARRVMQVGGAISAVFLFSIIGVLLLREKRKNLLQSEPIRNHSVPSEANV